MHAFSTLNPSKPVIQQADASLVGLPLHLGGVACALGPWWWTNNSTDLFDMKWMVHLLPAVASNRKVMNKRKQTEQGARKDSTIEYKIYLVNN